MTETQPSITTPWRRDAEHIAAGLAAWARAWRGSAAVVADVRMPGSGMANDTVLFRLDNDALVARLAPAPDSRYPTFPSFDLAFQRKVIDLVRARTSVPAPDVVHLETSDEWVGVPFMVVRAIEGNVADDNPPYLFDPNGWFLRGTPDDWTRFETGTLELFVQLHTIIDSGETAFLHVDTAGDTALARLLASHRAYYDWARDGLRVPILERAFGALTATLPANDRAVLLWGDGRPGNIIYRDFEPAGALDWEMAGIGPPEADVAWTTFFQRFFGHFAESLGLPPVPAMFDREHARAVYERQSGRGLDDLAWYEALAGLRFGIILLRMSLRSIAYGQQAMPANPDDLIVFAPLLATLLADL
jgi:aminoglycoside phosphotransferase (APT) family kinase protein